MKSDEKIALTARKTPSTPSFLSRCTAAGSELIPSWVAPIVTLSSIESPCFASGFTSPFLIAVSNPGVSSRSTASFLPLSALALTSGSTEAWMACSVLKLVR